MIWHWKVSDVAHKIKKKKSESELLPAFWKKIQNTQQIKSTLLNCAKQDKTCTFLRKSSFSSYVQHRNKQFNLSCVRGWLKEKGMRLADMIKKKSVSCLFPSTSLQASNWHKISWISCLFFCFMFYIALKRELPWKFACFVLFIQLKSVLLISRLFWIWL